MFFRMKSKIFQNIKSALLAFAIGLAVMCSPVAANALTLETYAAESALKEGHWVKVSVTESGMHKISNADLKKWGFSDPSKVRVFGYGGQRLPDILDGSYVDDLPMTPSVAVADGIVFYAYGLISWNNSRNQYVHAQNPFATAGYYFLTDSMPVDDPMLKSGTGSVDASDCAVTFTERLFHEKELMSPGLTGHLLVGEDFKYTTSQNFTFALHDKADNQMWMQYSFVTKTHSSPSRVTVTVNGANISSTPDAVPSTSNDSYSFATEGVFNRYFDVEGDKLTVGMTYKSPVTVQLARLNYITLNYTRHIKMRDGLLNFRASHSSVSLANATADTHVWDVTNPMSIFELNTSLNGSDMTWTNVYTGKREYAAWNENAKMLSPVYVGTVSNQNIHAQETPDMVIFTLAEWQSQAERVADLHRNSSDSLKVLVVTQEQVFNEFSSGTPDANSFRKLLKMFYDRGNANGGTQLRYTLFMGRGIYDNRHITDKVKALGYPTMPIWQTENGTSDNLSYSTDDIMGILDDNSGIINSSTQMNIAVGRMPVKSFDEAKTAVDKLYAYINNPVSDQWKNQVLLVADDQDKGAHMKQTEQMYDRMMASDAGREFFYNKLYFDVYTPEGGNYPQARTQMLQKLNEGVMWWNYIGHANTTSWSHEQVFTYSDITNLYLKRLPVLYAATCEFMRWDTEEVSGAEIMFLNPNGGVIAAISASRPVYIAQNGMLSINLGNMLMRRDDNGNFFTIGEVLRQTKNATTGDSNNKLRFALMGDPAMRFAAPSSTIALESIDGRAVNLNDQVTIQARQDVTLKGSVCSPAGDRLSGFNGTITVTMYDAEKSITTKGNGKEGEQITFEEQGSRLYVGRGAVANGQFDMKVSMPLEIASNFRPAALSMYAHSDVSGDAIGCNRDFYVYGYDDSAEKDTEPPVISAYYLNHESFKSGGEVNESPMVLAQISDNKGINLSSAGIGHQMTLILDGTQTFTDVSQYYTPSATGENSGAIAYPVSGLMEGNHTMKLRVWDVAGNPAESTIDFFVKQGLAPKIYDIYSDANPASTEANFYITHNRPEASATITVTVYNLMGQMVWTSTVSGRNDMLRSFPVKWNLCDMAGRRVNRGIYIYKASITTDGEQFSTESKKIAVTAAP